MNKICYIGANIMDMVDVARFSDILRKKGIPASVRSTHAAFQALQIFKNSPSKNTYAHLKEAFAAIYIKNNDQQKEFDEVFQEVFGEFLEEKQDIILQSDSKNRKNPGKDRKNPENYKLEQMSLNFKSDIKKDSKFEIKKIKEEDINFNPPIEDYGLDLGENSLMERDINTLDFFEPELFDLCQKLGRKIANKRARRNKIAKNTRIDIRKSIRKNMKYGGPLIELVKSKPNKKKSQHFFLSDVSGSCDWISNWFFCMVYAAQKSFYRTRFFDFDNKSVETTSALAENNLMDAFTRARDIRQKNIMLHGTSNMHLAFESFLNQTNLNHKSLVLILTDCRDWAGPKENGRPLSAEIIGQMCNVSKRVIILNPEPEIKWDVVDSCVSYYRDAGARVIEVRNLKQLSQLVENI
jgi:uncharacterized protein with von Willebrand factor type A (vWA) domain